MITFTLPAVVALLQFTCEDAELAEGQVRWGGATPALLGTLQHFVHCNMTKTIH